MDYLSKTCFLVKPLVTAYKNGLSKTGFLVKPLVTEVRKGCLSMTGFLVKPLVTEVRKGCLSMAGFLVKPLVTEVTETGIRVITKLLNSEQSYKGKVKTHNYINRQNQSTTGKL
jgi:hypothetical protein